MFDIAVQAAIGSHIKPVRRKSAAHKRVAKCYGGDITRKRSCGKAKSGKKSE